MRKDRTVLHRFFKTRFMMVHNDHIQKINGTEETYIEPLENFTR